MKVTAIDVCKRLAVEFPGTGISGRGFAITFTGPAAKACKLRAAELMEKAVLFNHYFPGSLVKRNWWKRV